MGSVKIFALLFLGIFLVSARVSACGVEGSRCLSNSECCKDYTCGNIDLENNDYGPRVNHCTKGFGSYGEPGVPDCKIAGSPCQSTSECCPNYTCTVGDPSTDLNVCRNNFGGPIINQI